MTTGPTRSQIMQAVGRSNTRPELAVRRILHGLGLRFRLHRKDLPGTPDIVLPRYQTAVFVHGCFWHRHEGCSRTTTPKTRADFWSRKFQQNVARDRKNEELLTASGWSVLTVWECETKRPGDLRSRLAETFSVKAEPLMVATRNAMTNIRPAPGHQRSK